MAYVRRRTTKTGVISTALVESYRDEKGRPRQRLLANLRGAETLEAALGRLAAERDRLRKERVGLEPELPHAEKFYEIITLNTLHGHRYSDEERKEIDRLLKKRKRMLKRLAAIDSRVAEIQKDGAIIKRHCKATDAEIRTEAAKHAKHLYELECLQLGMSESMGMRLSKSEAKAMLALAARTAPR